MINQPKIVGDQTLPKFHTAHTHLHFTKSNSNFHVIITPSIFSENNPSTHQRVMVSDDSGIHSHD